MNIWVYTGEVNAKRIREKYLRAVLRQDIGWFDNVGPGEVATRIQTDTRELSKQYCSGQHLFNIHHIQIWFNREFPKRSLL